MVTVSAYLNKLERINIEAESVKSIDQTKDEIPDLNRERMLSGKRADGSIMPDYSPISVSVYGYPPGPIRLKATGSFQRSITVKVEGKSIVTDSTDDKSMMLQKRYGSDIFGLDKEGRIDYVKVLQPVLVDNVKKSLL